MHIAHQNKNYSDECHLSATPYESGAWITDGAHAPWISLEWADAEARFSGTAQSFVGHRMRVPGDARPRGLWGEWFWDGKTLTAEVDPLGYFSLFVYAHDGKVGVSPSMLQLLAAGADSSRDEIAMAVFHRLGFFVGNDTPFKYIRALPPGGRLTWCDGKLDIVAPSTQPRTLALSREQAVEAFIELPRTSIRQFLDVWDGPIALPLSGGRDSRHILLEMAHQGRKPDTCITFHHGGSALNAEVQAARAVAERTGVKHTILGHPRMRFRDAVRGILLTQLCSDEHAQMMPMHDYLAGTDFAAIDGIAGDILTNPDDKAAGYMARSLKGDYVGIAREMCAGLGDLTSRGGHTGGAATIFSAELEEAAIDHIAAAIREHDAAPDPYQSFWFWSRTRREISFVSTAIMGGAAMVYCPYLDPDFVDLGLSLPWNVTRDQKLHDDAINRAYPAFSDIPFADGFTDQPLARFRLNRLPSIVDNLRIAAIAGSGSAWSGMKAAIAPSPLWRGAWDIYRLHNEFVESMNTTEAQRLIDLSEQLSAEVPRNDEVVSNVY